VSTRGFECTATPERIWDLVARPDLWHRWSPHVRGAEGLGSPEVRQGARGRVVLRGGIKVPAEILKVTPGQSWSWQVGGIVVHHIVAPAPGGSSLAMPVESAGRLWTPAALAYAPVVDLIARRIARVAEDESDGP
jgi:uncharacterized protein YndB with AHSA1/START domain